MANPTPFTPEEVAQILEAFFETVGTRQYIGARYVPIFGRRGEASIVWDNTKPYEPLTIVLYQGNSFTSRQYVPEGVEITNAEFWAETGNYNAQIEQYRRETASAKATADQAVNDIETLLPKSAFSESNTVKNYIDLITINLINVDEYGADPTGQTDSTAAFQAAINESVSSRSNGIYVGNGKYLLTGTITVNGPLNIVGNPSMFPCEFWPSGTPVRDSYIKFTSNVLFEISGYNINDLYGWSPINLCNVMFEGTGTNTFAHLTAAGGPERPSNIDRCMFYSMDKVFTFDNPRNDGGTMLDLLTISNSVFLLGNYIFFDNDMVTHQRSSIGACLVTDCCFDNFFGINAYGVHGALTFIDCIIEGANNTTNIDLTLTARGSITFKGCYFEGNYGECQIKGTVQASEVYSCVEFDSCSSFSTPNFNLLIDSCNVRVRGLRCANIKTRKCILIDYQNEYMQKDSCGLIRSKPSTSTLITTEGGTPNDSFLDVPIYIESQRGTSTLTLAADSTLVIWMAKQRANLSVTINGTTYPLPFEAGIAFIALDLPAGTYPIEVSGPSSKLYYRRQGKTTYGYVLLHALLGC